MHFFEKIFSFFEKNPRITPIARMAAESAAYHSSSRLTAVGKIRVIGVIRGGFLVIPRIARIPRKLFSPQDLFRINPQKHPFLAFRHPENASALETDSRQVFLC